MSKKLAVLASGTGSIFEAMLEEKLPIELLLADRECRAVDIAKKAGITTVIIPRTFGKSFDRDLYTREVMTTLHKHKIDLVALAGFMTLFASPMFEEEGFAGRILNTHPSLLPAFKGGQAVRDALEYGVKITGCTVHIVTEDMDAGPILAQEAVDVLPSNTVEILHARIKVAERKLYPETIRKFLE